MIIIIQKWNQGRTDGTVLEKSKAGRKYDDQLDVDEMHTPFYSVFIQTSSGDFDIFRATTSRIIVGRSYFIIRRLSIFFIMKQRKITGFAST